MHRLSGPIETIKANYNVVVVGSGYGGAIAASRMSRAGQRVCILERGKEFQPGEYPHNEAEALEQMQIDAPGLQKGPATGLYDFRMNEDMNVFVGCGLGGTSLVNANVSLPPDPRVFQDPRWPAKLRTESAGMSLEADGTLTPSDFQKSPLGQGFVRAIEMLKPSPYLGSVPKLEALAKSAQATDGRFYRPPINVTFKDGVNHVGVQQRKCEDCGDCVSGCNHFAKNTVLMNYLPDARNHGAEIFTEVSVRYVERRESKWAVYFSQIGRGEEEFNAPPQFVLADIVVLAAGTLGSTEILLRSKQMGLPVSSQLGRSFTGNGDVLAFGYNTDRKINGVGFGDQQPSSIGPVGPCITGIIDHRKTPNVKDGFVIEEGSLPGPLGRILPGVLALASKAVGINTAPGTLSEITQKGRELESLIGGPHCGAVNHTQTYLVMAHDDGNGVMRLDSKDRLRIDWPSVEQEPVFDAINDALKMATTALKGIHLENPIWSELFKHRLITVHPLGGCVMADNAADGVINDKGKVFAATEDNQVHDGLYVADGSIIPTPIGVNPLLTISALAERICTYMAQDHGWNINFDPYQLAEADGASTIGMQWTEAMEGYFCKGPDAVVVGGNIQSQTKQLCTAAAERGQKQNSKLKFVITVSAPNAETFFADAKHEALFTGELAARVLDEEPLAITNGIFNLFYDDAENPETQHMRYQMNLTSATGKHYFFDGFKIIHHDKWLDLWPDTTTLYATVYKGDDASGSVFGRGVIRLSPKQLAEMMTTMKVTNATSTLDRLSTMARFGKLFLNDMLQMYGGVFSRPTTFNPDAPPRAKRQLRTNPPEIHWFNTDDGLTLRLTRYQGGNKGPVILSHGLGVSSSIFSIDTIDTNLTEFLYAAGYDVWLLDFRASIDLPYARPTIYEGTGGTKLVRMLQFTGDDIAKFDYPAAVKKVREVTSAASVQFVVHCFGSTTFFMSMLAPGGLKDVRSFVASQIATRMITGPLTRLKTGLQFPSLLEDLEIDYLNADIPFDIVEKSDDGHVVHRERWWEKLYDATLRLYPIPITEWCKSPVCHRIAFMYSPLYDHAQLNQATHAAMHEMFGAGNMKAFVHLARLTNKKCLVDFDGNDIYMPNLKQLALPICFIHGEDNRCFLPESTKLTVDDLQRENGDLYTRHVIPGYGHIDCIFGKNAARDVYPFILEHLNKTNEFS